VVFPWNLADQAAIKAEQDLRDTISAAFPVQFNRPDSLLGFRNVTNAESFKAELTKLLTKYAADVNRSLTAVRKLPQAMGFSNMPQLEPAGTLR
jgi:hypothetical protein